MASIRCSIQSTHDDKSLQINHGLLTRQLQRMEVKSTSKDAKHHEKVQKLLENEKKATELRRERKKMLDEMFRSTKPKVCVAMAANIGYSFIIYLFNPSGYIADEIIELALISRFQVSKPTIRRSNEDEERFEFLRRGAMPHPNERSESCY